ncbi:hypothetical protein CC1G_03824 [Coprinopsis cinerea okayama7|uniref:Uncharacterized protein n=1 Tax=Coprinopsis cinerea (strain Okayama-7 / 130 / ATCC MYA-4618 / FGSC 9003) TaxID=240176 RepID=A8NGV1_COPC7|nr:hypothetical protein CC1G_03824 [Coprinopsis cinerea okayama7\|eukprot:XP_001833607.1 hypothetical protein CC1G_03824 [Coprinopsis cinerea okayama7\
MAPPRGTETSQAGGLDEAFLMSIVDKIPKNPVTGKVEMTDIMRYLENNPEEMNQLIGQVDSEGSSSQTLEDLSGFDFKSLAKEIKKNDVWILQMDPFGYADENDQPVEAENVHTVPGARPVFLFYCYDTREVYRCTVQHVGLPTSDFVLKVIQQAMAKPLTPSKPALPELLIISSRLAQQAEGLRPFLDSLPKPFRWRLETREEAQAVADGVFDLNKKNYKAYMERAEKAKASGNKAFVSKDRDSALKAYTTAIEALEDAVGEAASDEEEKKAKQFLAVCFANRAATHLLPGALCDPEKALKDGKNSEKADPLYVKGYIRQATACQRLGRTHEAREAITRALRKKELENDSGLVDKLIELTTDGKGLSNDEAVFKQWMLDIMITDKKTGDLLHGLGGEWKRRISAQFKIWRPRGPNGDSERA